MSHINQVLFNKAIGFKKAIAEQIAGHGGWLYFGFERKL